MAGSWGRGPKEGDGLSATPSNLRFDEVRSRMASRARGSKRLLTNKIRTQGPRCLPASDEVAEPMRVCVVGSGWRFLSGVSFYTCRMANALSEDGYSVSAILMRRLLPKRLYPGRDRVGASLSDLRYSGSIQVIDGIDYYWLPSIIPAIRHLWKVRPQVVVFEWWTSTVAHTYLALAVLSRLLGAEIVVEFHESLDSAEERLVVPGLYARLLLWPILQLAESFAVHSAFDRKAIAEQYPLGSKPITIVTHGPYDHFVPKQSTESGRDGLCRLLYFGTIRPYKGLEYLIEAFDRLDDLEARRFHLTVVGETWEGWRLPAALIERSRHRDQITFVNRYVTDNEAQQFFSECDAVVLPYLRSSASGPMHIAMSFGLPLIVTDVGGLTEVALQYGGTILVPPGDADSLLQAILKVGSADHIRYKDPVGWGDSARTIGVPVRSSHRIRTA